MLAFLDLRLLSILLVQLPKKRSQRVFSNRTGCGTKVEHSWIRLLHGFGPEDLTSGPSIILFRFV